MNFSYSKKVPYVEQLSITECGLCCVAMLLRYYRSYESLHDLREYLDIGRDGSSIKQLIDLLGLLKFKAKAYKAQTQGLSKIKLPSIIFWEDKHFVVLERINNKYAWIVDPAYGRVKLSLSEFEKSYSNYVISAVPDEDFLPKKKGESIWRKYSSILFTCKGLFLQIILLSIISYLFTIAMPIFIQRIIDGSIYNPENQPQIGFYVLMGAISIVYLLIDYLKNHKLINLRIFIDKTVSSDLFNHLLKLPFKYFDIRNKADILSSLSSTSIIRETFARQLIGGIIDIGAISFIIFYMFSQSIIMSELVIAILAINIVIVLNTKPRLIDYNKYLVTQQNKYQSIQIESIYSILGIKMSAIEEDVYKRWSERFNDYLSKYKYRENFNNYLNSLMTATQVVGPIIILTVGIYFMSIGSLTIGQVVAFYSLSATFFSLSSSIFDTWISYLNSKAYLERIGDVVYTQQEEAPENNSWAQLSGNIKFNEVSFSYTRCSKKVINRISLEINQGQKIAIVGKSGSGKSTLVKLLVGLYSPTEGEIYIDGFPMSNIDKKYVRKQMGIVPQEVTLFNKTIFENISMERKDVSLEQVVESAKIAQIHDEIDSMPLKYNTIVSEMGVNLSGGQRQRIALARAIVNRPKLIVLDEATSSLDNINETKVANYFSRIGSTRVIVAHRLSTIMDADRIFVMKDGEIVEQGTHDELIKLQGQYCELYHQAIESNAVTV